VSLIVVHAISLPPAQFGGEGIVRLFTNRLDAAAHPYFAQISLAVSAHFLLRRDGELIQFVSCRQRAWHAGLSSWQGRRAATIFAWGSNSRVATSCHSKRAVRLSSADCSAPCARTTRSSGCRAQRHLSRSQDRPGPVSTGSGCHREFSRGLAADAMAHRAGTVKSNSRLSRESANSSTASPDVRPGRVSKAQDAFPARCCRSRGRA
jgi:hypothetical protein